MQFRQLALGIILTWMVATLAKAEVATNPPLGVMTYNLRYASQTGPNAWPQRRPLVREVIESVKPDIIGTQEGLHSQLLDVAADLPDYRWVGSGRDDGGVRGEFTAVLYRPDRLTPLTTNHFWLSDTPEVPGSTTWGNKVRRMVTWLKFHDRSTGTEFYLFNTHFDHEVSVAREKSAALLRQRIAALDAKHPVLLVGDFNTTAGHSKPFELLTADGFLADTWTTARERINDGVNTFNGFEPLKREGERIDWILARGMEGVSRAEILTFSKAGQFPSDHFPVVSWIKLPVQQP